MSEQDGVGAPQWTQDIHQGDAKETLSEMPESSVHCVMTSPPYFGLRDYGVDGQIGLEDDLDEYIDTIVEVADELRRVLRDDGSWWLNLGDSFAGSWGAQSKDETENNLAQHDHPDKNPARNGQMRRKNKMLVPHRVVIALQDAGWIVRSDAVWNKPNPMPHPVKDRLHEHKEFVFHLTPEPDYWFDLDAIRAPHKEKSLERREREDSTRGGVGETGLSEHTGIGDGDLHPNGKNPGDVMEITVKAFPEAHFAVYPPELCELPIKSTAPEKVCGSCGKPYERVDENADLRANPNDRRQKAEAVRLAEQHGLSDEHLEAIRKLGFHDAGNSNHEHDGGYGKVDDETGELAREAKEALGSYAREFWTIPREGTNWVQECDCETDETEPGVVLDPFAGAGTTCLVAKRLGRRFVGIELNQEYVAMAQKRVGVTVDEPGLLLEDGETALTAYADGGEARD